MAENSLISPQGRVEIAGALLADTEKKAAGRSLTNNQETGVASAVRAMGEAVLDMGGTADEYVRRLAADAARAVDEGDTELALRAGLEVAKVVRFEQTRSRSEKAAGRDVRTPVVERASGVVRFHNGDLFSTRALAGDVVDGSYVVAKDYADVVWSRLYENNALLRAGMTEFETSDHSFILPVGTASVTATVVGQGTAITASDPGFTQVEITPQRFAARTTVSQEFWSDITGPQKEYVLGDHIKSISDLIETEILSGNGSPGFTGLYGTTAAGTVTGGTAAAVGLSPFASALGTAWANNIQPTNWVLHPTDFANFVAVTEKGTATTGSIRPLLTPALNAGGAAVTTIYGLPVIVTPNAAAGTALLIDAKQLLFVRRTGVEQLADPYSLSANYQVSLRTVVRAGFHALAGRFVRISSLA